MRKGIVEVGDRTLQNRAGDLSLQCVVTVQGLHSASSLHCDPSYGITVNILVHVARSVATTHTAVSGFANRLTVQLSAIHTVRRNRCAEVNTKALLTAHKRCTGCDSCDRASHEAAAVWRDTAHRLSLLLTEDTSFLDINHHPSPDAWIANKPSAPCATVQELSVIAAAR